MNKSTAAFCKNSKKEKVSKAKINKKKTEIGKPSLAAIIIGVIMFLITFIMFLVGANEKCDSSCGAVSVGAISIIVSTPIMAYGLSLIVVSMLFWLVRQHTTIQTPFENHPILWLILGSIILFFPICFVIVQVIRVIPGI